MKKKKFLLSFMLICISILALGSISVSAYTFSGDCGKNVSYSLDNKGVLTISGNGAMSDYVASPFSSKQSSIKSVVIYSGVTSIGKCAFDGLSNLKSVAIADSVTEIGDFAFRGTAITDITLGKNVWSIGKQAFAGCKKLNEINLNSFPYMVGTDIFYNSNSDMVVKIRISTLEDYLNRSRDAFMPYVDEIYIGNKLITDKSFWETQTTIPDETFKGYGGVTEFEISDTITRIGENAFKNCKNMTKVLLPHSITNIGNSAFLTGGNLTTVLYNGNESSWNSISIGTNNEALNVRKCFAYVTLKNTEDTYSETQMCIVGDTLDKYFDLNELEKKYTKEIEFYLDDEYRKSYDPSLPILNDFTLYIKLGAKIDKYYNLAYAEMSGFEDTITPSDNNTQTISLTINGKRLGSDDYTVWYYTNTICGNAKMLIIGIGEYHGYIEKEFAIKGDTVNAPLSSTVYVRPTDNVKIAVPTNIVEMSYKKDGMVLSTSKNYFSADDAYKFSEGVHTVTYTYTWSYSEEVWDASKGKYITITHILKPTETVTIKAYDEDVAKIEVAQILEGGRDTYYVQATVLPIYAKNAELVWTSSDTSVALVDKFGVVKVKKAGKTVIAATTANGKTLSVDMDIEPLKITNVTLKSIKENDSTHEIVLQDKYGILRENQDYIVNYSTENDILKVEINGINLYSGRITKGYNISDLSEAIVYGDIDGDGEITMNDAIYLFNAAMFPNQYHISAGQKTDYNGDSKFDMNDAIYLFNHAMFPEQYPI